MLNNLDRSAWLMQQWSKQKRFDLRLVYSTHNKNLDLYSHDVFLLGTDFDFKEYIMNGHITASIIQSSTWVHIRQYIIPLFNHKPHYFSHIDEPFKTSNMDLSNKRIYDSEKKLIIKLISDLDVLNTNSDIHNYVRTV